MLKKGSIVAKKEIQFGGDDPAIKELFQNQHFSLLSQKSWIVKSIISPLS